MEKIEGLVLKLCKKYKTNSPFKLCEFLKIFIVPSELPDSVQGLVLRASGKNVILLNNSLSEQKLINVCAHELGHVLLHKDFNTLNLDEEYLDTLEREADFFAERLLYSEKIKFL